MTTIYKIRSKKTGLYSLGGSSPRWSKNGKVWIGLGPLKNHLNVLREYGGLGKGIYKREEAELVEFQLTETEISKSPILDYIDLLEETAKMKLSERKKLEEERAKALRRKYFEELKKEFENEN